MATKDGRATIFEQYRVMRNILETNLETQVYSTCSEIPPEQVPMFYEMLDRFTEHSIPFYGSFDYDIGGPVFVDQRVNVDESWED